jgi:non-ribosomal peptide synthetase component E (peptide arylation enzyme)
MSAEPSSADRLGKAYRPERARHDNYAHTVLHAMTDKADRVVLHWRDRAVTAAEFAGSITDAAAALHRAGVAAGDIVAILTEPNHPMMLSTCSAPPSSTSVR